MTPKLYSVNAPALCLSLAAFVCLGSAGVSASDFQGATHIVPIDGEGINYTKGEPKSEIAQLQKRIDSGETKLAYDEKFGYLPGLLKELNIPASSQMLVFSKTSLQRERISPKNPRSIYFNDDVYVGYIPGAPLIELSVADPELGGVFYSIEQKQSDRPFFRRTDQCLECHASTKSMGVPGHLVRSFETGEDGVVDLATGISTVTHRTPFEERWGGWYVTGTHGEQTHRGNLIGKADFERHQSEPGFAGNLASLSKIIDTGKYVEPHSDVVSLMVLEHQVHMHNYITRIHYEAETALKTYGHVNYLKSVIEGFVRYCLFVEEAALTSEVKGTSDFQKEFEKLGPFDQRGRSLRQFDLQTRLFKYPCSFLIYSDAFDALPEQVKTKIYDRLWEVLSGRDQSETYAVLSDSSKRAVYEILRDTKKDLPDTWRSVAAGTDD